MKILYLIMFISVTIIHLYATYSNNRPFRNVTKGLIVLTLLGFYQSSVDEVSWAIVLALLLSWIGDMLLIPRGLKWFVSGGIAFMASHFFLVLGFLETFSMKDVPLVFVFGVIALYLIASAFVFFNLRKHVKTFFVFPLLFYLLVNATMNCFAWYRMIAYGFHYNTIISVVGAICFFLSDAALFFVNFNKQTRMKSHFLVMLTYSLGEFLIILGLII